MNMIRRTHSRTILRISVCGVVAAICVAVFAFGMHAHAAYNKQINYQGKLTGTANMAVPDGSYSVRFKLYTAQTGGSPIWTETLCKGASCDGSGTDGRVQVTNGLFSVMLGSSTPLTSVDFNQTLYLGVEIGGSNASTSWDGEMSPRKVLGAVPAAFVADTVQGVSASQFFRNDVQNSTSTASTFMNVVQNGAGKIAEFFGTSAQSVLSLLSNGNVGVGTTTPGNKFAVYSTTTNKGISSLLQNPNDGVSKYAGYFSVGSSATADSLYGVYGEATGSGDPNAVYGGYFTATGPSSIGLLGNGTTGIKALSNSSSGYGAYIQQSNSSGYSIYALGGKNYFEKSVGIGTNSPSAALHVLSTTEQMRLAYDASNYLSTTIGSAGDVTFDASGSGAGFTYNDPVTIAANGGLSIKYAGVEVLKTTKGSVGATSAGVFIDNKWDQAWTPLVVRGHGGQTADILRVLDGSNNVLTSITSAGSLGIGTSSPYRALSVSGDSVIGGNILATSFTATGTAASTFPYASTTAISWTATSTGSNGINLSAGCFAVNGTCLTNAAASNGLVQILHKDGTVNVYTATTSTDIGRGIAFLTAMSHAQDGDVVNLPTGTFDVGCTATIDLSLNNSGSVSLRGSGKYDTIIKTCIGSSTQVFLKTASHSFTSDLSLISTATSTWTGTQFTLMWGNIDLPVSSTTLENVYIRGRTDGVYFRGQRLGGGYGDTTTAFIKNVDCESDWDCFFSQDQGVIYVRDSRFTTVGTSFTNSGHYSDALIDDDEGTVYIYNSEFTAKGGTLANNGIVQNGSAKVYMYSGSISTSDTAALDFDTDISGTTAVTSNVIYDPTKVTGTVAHLDTDQLDYSLASNLHQGSVFYKNGNAMTGSDYLSFDQSAFRLNVGSLVTGGSLAIGVATSAATHTLDIQDLAGIDIWDAVTGPTYKDLSISGDYDSGFKVIQIGENTAINAPEIKLDQVAAKITLLGGNVGIGTASPLTDLNVYNSGLGGGILLQNSATGNTSGHGGSLTLDSQKNLYLMNNDASYLFLGANQATSMFLSPGGGVGVGNYPEGKFSVYTTTNTDGITIDGTSNPGLTLSNATTPEAHVGLATAGSGWTTGAQTNDLIFRTNDGTNGNIRFATQAGSLEAMSILRNGNVGIGSTTPTAKLSVAGNAIIGGIMTAGYFVGTSTATSTFGGSIQIGTSTDISNNPFVIKNWGDVDPATGYGSWSAGFGNQLVAVGNNDSVVLGNYNAVSNFVGTIVGVGNMVTAGEDTQVFGENNQAGNADIVIGDGNNSANVSGTARILLGLGNTANSGTSNNLLVGTGNSATAEGASAVGTGLSNSVAGSVDIGNSNTTKFTVGLTSTLVRSNLGIGTSTPGATLSVNGNSILGGNALAGYFTSTSTTANFFAYASTTALSWTATSTGNNGINLTSGCYAVNGTCIGGGSTLSGGIAGALTYWTGAGTIGATSSPTANYYVATSSTASIFPYASTTAISSTGSAFFNTSGTGYVGIGTTNPLATLTLGTSTNVSGVARELLRFAYTGDPTYFSSIKSATGGTAGQNKLGFYITKAGVETNPLLLSDTLNTITGTTTVSGNFGIGTTTPGSALSVYGSSDLGNFASAGYFLGTTTTTSILNGPLTAQYLAATSTSLPSYFGNSLVIGNNALPANADSSNGIRFVDSTISLLGIQPGNKLMEMTANESGPGTGRNTSYPGVKFQLDARNVSDCSNCGIFKVYFQPIGANTESAAFAISRTGNVNVGTGIQESESLAAFRVKGGSSWSTPTAIFDLGTSQTTDLTQWRNSSGLVLGALSSAGNLGLGASTTGKKLEVVGDIVSRVASTTGNGASSFIADVFGANIWANSSYDPSSPSSGWKRVLTASSSGAVGIGTTSPYRTLSVTGDGVVGGNMLATNFTATGTTASTFTYASTTALSASSQIFVSSSGTTPTLYNPTSGNGLILRGDTTGGQLRIVSNGGAWGSDSTTTTYFQITNNNNNNASFMGGTYGNDQILNRLQFGASSTQITDSIFSATARPNSLFGVVNTTANKVVANITGASAQSADYFDVTANGGSVGGLFAINSSGNVGIGTSPTQKLHVSGTSDTQVLIADTDGYSSTASGGGALNIVDNGTSMFSFYPNYADGRATIVMGNSSRAGAFDFFNWRSFGGTGSYDFNLTTKGSGSSATERLRITGNSAIANASFMATNVGIGTSTPFAKLGISLNAGESASNAFIISSTTAANATSTLFGITNSGSVGIGTANPLYKLDVVGNDISSGVGLSDGSSRYVNLFRLSNDGYLVANRQSSSKLFLGAGSAAYPNQLTIDGSTGNVGIGTTSPYRTLSVSGDAVVGGNALATNFTATSTTATSTFAGYISVDGTNSSSTFAGGLNVSGSAAVAGTIRAGSGTVTGNLGVSGIITTPYINISSPGSGNGTINFGANFGNSALTLYDGGAGSRYGWGLQAGEMQFYVTNNRHYSWNKGGDLQPSGTNEVMRLDTTNGALGIGTTSPYRALSVSGDGIVGGNFLASNFIATSSVASIFPYASSTAFTVSSNLYVGSGSTFSMLQGTTAGTSTIQGFLNVLGTNSTSTFSGNLAVSGILGIGSNAVINPSGISYLANGKLVIGTTTARGYFDVNHKMTVPTPSATTGVTFGYNGDATGNFTAEGITFNGTVVAYINGAWSITPLTMTGTDNGSSDPVKIIFSWGAVSGATKYRLYFEDPYFTGCTFYYCYLETASTSVALGDPNDNEENYSSDGIWPLTPTQYGPDFYVGDDSTIYSYNASFTTATSTWYGDGSHLSGIMTSPMSTTANFGGQYATNFFRAGIGTSSLPNYKLDVYNGGNSGSSIHWAKGDGSNFKGGGFLMSAGNGNSFWSTGSHHTGSGWVADDSNPVIFGAGANFDGAFTVYTDSGKTVNNSFSPTQRMVLTATGRFGLATTSPWKTLSITGTVGFDGLTSSVGAGSLCLTSTKEVVYNSGSDNCLSSLRSTKHDITPLALNAADMVNALKPVSFVYNTGDTNTRYGFIAEDSAAVDSHLGTYDADHTLSGVDDRAVLALLTKNLQDINAKVNVSSASSSNALVFRSSSGQGILTLDENGNARLGGDASSSAVLTVGKDVCVGTTCFDKTFKDLSAQVSSIASSTSGISPSLTNVASSITDLQSQIADIRMQISAASTTLDLASTTAYIASTTATTLASSTPFITAIAEAVKTVIQATSDWVVARITATAGFFAELTTEKITIGSAAKPAGITLYDEATGDAYCFKVVNGASATVLGECGSSPAARPDVAVQPEPAPTIAVSTSTDVAVVPATTSPATGDATTTVTTTVAGTTVGPASSATTTSVQGLTTSAAPASPEIAPTTPVTTTTTTTNESSTDTTSTSNSSSASSSNDTPASSDASSGSGTTSSSSSSSVSGDSGSSSQ